MLARWPSSTQGRLLELEGARARAPFVEVPTKEKWGAANVHFFVLVSHHSRSGVEKPIAILLLEDNKSDVELVHAELHRAGLACTVTVVDNAI